MKVTNIKLDLIDEDINQPRYTFNQSSIDELANSIKEVGLLNPIKVCLLPNGRYQIIFGNRRYKACKQLGFVEIPCILADNENEVDIYLEQLTENIQRESFTPIEEALAFQKMLENGEWKISKKMLAGKIGKPERYISNKLSLLAFGKKVRELLHSGKEILPKQLSEDQALKIVRVPAEYRDSIAYKIAQEQVSVEDVAKIAKLFTDKTISNQMKERYLNIKCSDLIPIWWEHEIARTKLFEDKQLNQEKTLNVITKQQVDTKAINEKEIQNIVLIEANPLQEILNQLNGRIPSHQPVPPNTEELIDRMSIDKRDEFYSSVNILLGTLEVYLSDWKEIKKLLEKKKLQGIKLIKS